jgi:predicted metal-dependent hydrolase
MVFKSGGEMNNLSSQARLQDDPGAQQHSFDERLAAIYPREYLEGIEHFNHRRYYDAHEVWEEIWLRSSADTKLFYQMLIQAAVGLHHYERGNARGARGMHKNVVEKIGRLPSVYMSLDLNDFARQFKSFLAELIEKGNEAPPPDDMLRPVIHLLTGGADG